MWQKLRHSMENLSLRRKILAILLAAMIPLTAISVVGMNAVTQIYTDLLYGNVAGRLSGSAQIIASQLKDIETLSSVIFSHDTVQSGLATICYSGDFMARSDANIRMRTLLTEYSANYRSNHVQYISLFSGGFSVSGNSYEESKVSDAVHETVRQQAKDADGVAVWVSAYDAGYRLLLGREVRRIQYLSLAGLGELIIGVDLDALVADATRFSDQFENAKYLILDQNGLVYHSPALSREQALAIRGGLSQEYQILQLEAGSFFAVQGSLGYNGWRYVCLVDYDEVLQTQRRVQLQFLAGLLLCSALLAVLASVLIASIDRHLQALVAKMTAMGENAPSIPAAENPYAGRTDELGVLHQQFDQMTVRLQHLIQTNYVNELLKREAQLKALENQINPHFLYNTLESVNWRAMALGAHDISTMVQALGALLRVTLSNNEEAFTLGQELDLVRHYMAIQTFRFEDRLDFSIQVSQELLRVPIPKLTLQPLVENAIYYGLEESAETCVITVTAQKAGDTLQILISNSGSLFEEDLLPKLRRGEVVPHGHGIGLLNIDERIRLTFGEAYGLRLFNREEQAVAMITVPLAPD